MVGVKGMKRFSLVLALLAVACNSPQDVLAKKASRWAVENNWTLDRCEYQGPLLSPVSASCEFYRTDAETGLRLEKASKTFLLDE